MSLIPFILDLADELNELSRSLMSGMDADDLGFGMYSRELPYSPPRRQRPVSHLYLLPNTRGRHHPYWHAVGKPCCNKETADKEATANINDKDNASDPANADGVSTAPPVVYKTGFQVSMNVKQFSPNELTVKTIDNCIVVEGQHDEKEDGHGVIARHFVRKYMVPKGFDPNEVVSTLSSDGILTIKAPTPPTKAEEKLERVVCIQHTGPAQLLMKDGPSCSGRGNNTQKQQCTTTTTTTQTSPIHHQEVAEGGNENIFNGRNGDANANEINAELEKATELVSDITYIEPMVLVENEIGTTIADIPMTDSAGIIENIVLLSAEEAAAGRIVGDPITDDIFIPIPPTAGDLVAAADAAILLAKAQCENGTKTAADELAD